MRGRKGLAGAESWLSHPLTPPGQLEIFHGNESEVLAEGTRANAQQMADGFVNKTRCASRVMVRWQPHATWEPRDALRKDSRTTLGQT